MPSKNQIDSVYFPDKVELKQKLVIGLTGSIDSLVAAYLLKIQKFDLIGVVITPSWENFKADRSKNLSCFIDDKRIQFIQDFCQQLKIPVEMVKSSGEFVTNVVDSWVGSKLTGTLSSACWSCHELRMRILFEKMNAFGAQGIATGHYAKIFYHAGHDTHFIHSSNDEEFDQSNLLLRLPREIIRILHLPLSDLLKKEVLKLAENFGIPAFNKELSIHQCFPTNEDTRQFLELMTPKKFNNVGDVTIFNQPQMASLGQHKGIIHYTYGESVVTDGLSKRGNYYITRYSFQEKKLLIETDQQFLREDLLLIDCYFSEEVLWSEPLSGFIQLGLTHFIPCWIYPKSLKSAYVVWEGKCHVLEGSVVSIFKRKGKNAKILLSGKVRYHHNKNHTSESEGEMKKKSVDFSKDF